MLAQNRYSRSETPFAHYMSGVSMNLQVQSKVKDYGPFLPFCSCGDGRLVQIQADRSVRGHHTLDTVARRPTVLYSAKCEVRNFGGKKSLPSRMSLVPQRKQTPGLSRSTLLSFSRSGANRTSQSSSLPRPQP